MSPWQSDITDAVRAAIAPLHEEINRLSRMVEQQQSADQPEYITVAEAAQILSLSEKTIRSYVQQGRFDVIRKGHKILILRDSIRR